MPILLKFCEGGVSKECENDDPVDIFCWGIFASDYVSEASAKQITLLDERSNYLGSPLFKIKKGSILFLIRVSKSIKYRFRMELPLQRIPPLHPNIIIKYQPQ